MKNLAFATLALLPLTFGLGCAVEPTDGDPGAPPAATTTNTTEAQPIRLDSSELGALSRVELPLTRLPRSAFALQGITTGLLGTEEVFTRTLEVGGRTSLVSPSWTVEHDEAGDVLALRQRAPEGHAPALATDEASLRTRSLERLRTWGIPDEEMGPVLQRTAMAQSRDDGVLTPPEARRYKTFVMRAVGGVRVQGHRAVLTHDLDGAFVRALVHWPALAPSGHKLHTRLSLPEVESRVRAELGAEGVAAGTARLRWKYLPTALENGEVTLTLVVGARTGLVSEEGLSEPQEVDVPVDAEP